MVMKQQWISSNSFIGCNLGQLGLQRILFCLLLQIFSRGAVAKIMTPPCEFDSDPADELPFFVSCLSTNGGVWVEKRSHTPEADQPPVLLTSSGSVTSIISKWIVVQGSAHARIFKEHSTETVLNRDIDTDTLLVQVGNKSLHRHRLFAGIGQQPIGLNLNLNSKWYGFETSQRFYGGKTNLAGYTYDNRKDVTFTVSAAVKDDFTDDASQRSAALSSRLSYDFAALEGSRILVSFSTTEVSERIGGVALLNINGRGDRTSIEWLRTWTQYPYEPNDFDQMFRLNWTSKTSDKLRTGVQYQDIAGESRRGTVALEYEWSQFIDLFLTTGFQRNETRIADHDRSPNFWFATIGSEVGL